MTTPIEKAAMWLSERKETPQPVMQILMDKFSLTTSEAAKACTLANAFRSEKRTRE